MVEGSYTAICEAYDKLYKRLPTRKLIRVSAALPMLMGENEDGDGVSADSDVVSVEESAKRERFSESVLANAERIFGFFRDNGVEIDPLPKIVISFDRNEPTDPLIRTGCYDCDGRTITLCCSNRHLKDVLRTFCHELVHHNQNLLNPETFKRMNKDGKLRDNAELSDMESDAYARGNVMFRKWTESL